MADQAPAIKTTFPAPPPFYKSFTAENLERREQHLQDASQSSSDPSNASLPGLDLLALPPELRNLIPPAPPADGKYRSFGVEHDVSNASATEDQVQPTPARLQSLTHGLLLSFLQLTHLLATNPGAFAPTWSALEAAFKEINVVINGYRPHQARETLILMMEEQIKKVRDETEEVRESMGRANEMLEALGRGGGIEGGLDNEDAGKLHREQHRTKRREDSDKRVWEALEREVGRC